MASRLFDWPNPIYAPRSDEADEDAVGLRRPSVLWMDYVINNEAERRFQGGVERSIFVLSGWRSSKVQTGRRTFHSMTMHVLERRFCVENPSPLRQPLRSFLVFLDLERGSAV